jgi:hypothetical protein
VQTVYQDRYGVRDSGSTSAELPDGTPLYAATAAALDQNNYRIEFQEDSIGTKYACLTLPATVSSPVIVVDGRC